MNRLGFYFFCTIFALFLFPNLSFSVANDDELIKTLEFFDIEKPKTNEKYNYESFERVPIYLQISEKVTTKKAGVFEGQVLEFKVKENVEYKDEVLIKKGIIVKAKIKTIITKGMNGIPAEIVVNDFIIPDIDNSKIYSNYSKRGANRTLLVLPIKWILTPIPFAGSFTNLIIGGDAKIDKKDEIVLYYYPEWGDLNKKMKRSK